MEREAWNAMALLAQALRLPDDRRPERSRRSGRATSSKLLEPNWVEKRETALNRVRGRIETVIAKNVDIDDNEISQSRRTDAAVSREASEATEADNVGIHPALPYADASQIHDGPSLCRRSRSRRAALPDTHGSPDRMKHSGARWTDRSIGLRTVWNIQGGKRMKMGEDHNVSLSGPALDNLDEMREGLAKTI